MRRSRACSDEPAKAGTPTTERIHSTRTTHAIDTRSIELGILASRPKAERLTGALARCCWADSVDVFGTPLAGARIYADGSGSSRDAVLDLRADVHALREQSRGRSKPTFHVAGNFMDPCRLANLQRMLAVAGSYLLLAWFANLFGAQWPLIKPAAFAVCIFVWAHAVGCLLTATEKWHPLLAFFVSTFACIVTFWLAQRTFDEPGIRSGAASKLGKQEHCSSPRPADISWQSQAFPWRGRGELNRSPTCDACVRETRVPA